MGEEIGLGKKSGISSETVMRQPDAVPNSMRSIVVSGQGGHHSGRRDNLIFKSKSRQLPGF